MTSRSRSQHLLPGLQRQRHHRQPGDDARCMTAATLTPDYEVIVVNDGSADATPRSSTSWRASTRSVRVVHHPRNRGYGGALRSGFATADQGTGLLHRRRRAVRPGRDDRCCGQRRDDDVDLVNGYKISRSDPLHRIVIGRVYHHTVKLLFGLRVRDVDCDFRLMRRSIFDRVTLEKNSGVICLEMMKKIKDAGFRIAEVPVHHYHRAYGKSQFFNFRAHRQDRRRRAEALVRAGGPPQPPSPGGRRCGIAAEASRPAGRTAGRRAHERRLPRVLPRPPRDDHRRPRLHRQQPRPPAGRRSAPTSCSSIR